MFWRWNAIDADTRIETKHSKDVDAKRTTLDAERREVKDDIKTEEEGEQPEENTVSEKQN